LDFFNVKDLSSKLTEPIVKSVDSYKYVNETPSVPTTVAPNSYSDWSVKPKERRNWQYSGDLNRENRICVLSSDHLSGLLEAEPLSFDVIRGSDHMRLCSAENPAMSYRVPSDTDTTFVSANEQKNEKVRY